MKTKELREKPGRKPIQDKKEPVTIYVRKSDIKRHGGRKELRYKLINFVESAPFVIVGD